MIGNVYKLFELNTSAFICQKIKDKKGKYVIEVYYQYKSGIVQETLFLTKRTYYDTIKVKKVL